MNSFTVSLSSISCIPDLSSHGIHGNISIKEVVVHGSADSVPPQPLIVRDVYYYIVIVILIILLVRKSKSK